MTCEAVSIVGQGWRSILSSADCDAGVLSKKMRISKDDGQTRARRVHVWSIPSDYDTVPTAKASPITHSSAVL